MRPPRTLISAAVLLAAGAANAAPLAVAPAGGGQRALTVGVEGGALRAVACAQAPCPLAKGLDLQAPPEVVAVASATVVGVGEQRHAVHVVAARPDGTHWEAIVVAPPGGGEARAVFAGPTGYVSGEDGLRSGPMVSVSGAAADGTRRIVVGEQREDLTLCGRPAVLSPKVLSAKDLALHPAKVQRLSVEERDAAPSLDARRVDGAPASVPLLRAVAATSGTRPDFVADGDPETSWSEGRGGEGRGEFVILKQPAELPVSGFEFVVRPPTAHVENGVSPRSFFLALERHLFRVVLAEDAWAHPGARYRVELPGAVTSDCVAFVADDAFGTGKDVRVTVAELAAVTQLDPKDLPALVKALSGTGATAVAAAAMLRNLGDPAFDAVEGAYASLDDGARRLALDVVDHAPCARGASLYARALIDRSEQLRAHASARLDRCGAQAAPVMVRVLGASRGPQQVAVAERLATMAPADATAAIPPVLAGARSETRLGLRVALARAIQSRRADAAVGAVLASGTLPDATLLDVLRAIGERLPEFGAPATSAFARLEQKSSDFRTRFLLMEPAAHLEAKDATARRFLEQALAKDPSHFIRAQAAQAIRRVDAYRDALVRALGDENVRVRESAAQTLGRAAPGAANAPLVQRLQQDSWPIVRAAAARSLARSGKGAAVDTALASALEDESRHVRYASALALGNRGALAHAADLRDLLDDRDEHPHVRSASARALGMMCDRESIDLLAKYARRLAEPAATEALQEIGPGALWSLGQLGPSDLAARLAPLRSPEARPDVRALAARVLSQRPACPAAK